MANRRSIRLKDYDYSSPGAYFITICAQDRACLFSNIVAGKVILSDSGKMISKWLNKLSAKFTNVKCKSYVFMPNHIHFIVTIVGADQCVCPNHNINYTTTNKGKHPGLPLHSIVQWFKTMTTNEYIYNVKNNGWAPFNKRLWQRNYYEHVIRNEHDYAQLSEYIENNPLKWELDSLHPMHKQI